MSQIVINNQEINVAVIDEGVAVYAQEENVQIAAETVELRLTVEERPVALISVAESGPQGVKGDKGDPGGIYIHEQASPSATWTVNHNLNIYPVPQIVDSAGNTVEGDITYVSANTLTVKFSSAFAGKIYLAY